MHTLILLLSSFIILYFGCIPIIKVMASAYMLHFEGANVRKGMPLKGMTIRGLECITLPFFKQYSKNQLIQIKSLIINLKLLKN